MDAFDFGFVVDALDDILEEGGEECEEYEDRLE